MAGEWGPWVEHDGKGCPCVGQYVHRVYNLPARDILDGIVKAEKIGIVRRSGRSWGDYPGFNRVLRYRIRKPLGLTILEQLLQDLPAPVGPKVDA